MPLRASALCLPPGWVNGFRCGMGGWRCLAVRVEHVGLPAVAARRNAALGGRRRIHTAVLVSSGGTFLPPPGLPLRHPSRRCGGWFCHCCVDSWLPLKRFAAWRSAARFTTIASAGVSLIAFLSIIRRRTLSLPCAFAMLVTGKAFRTAFCVPWRAARRLRASACAASHTTVRVR